MEVRKMSCKLLLTLGYKFQQMPRKVCFRFYNDLQCFHKLTAHWRQVHVNYLKSVQCTLVRNEGLRNNYVSSKLNQM